MTKEEFKKTIANNGGEACVLAITFDNSASKSFVFEQFSYAKNLDEETDTLRFVEQDLRCNTYLVVKHIENIQAIHFTLNNRPRTAYDSKTVVG